MLRFLDVKRTQISITRVPHPKDRGFVDSGFKVRSLIYFLRRRTLVCEIVHQHHHRNGDRRWI